MIVTRTNITREHSHHSARVKAPLGLGANARIYTFEDYVPPLHSGYPSRRLPAVTIWIAEPAYLELALGLGLPLATRDAWLARAAKGAGVALITA
jgi:hypothetical protein